MKVKNGTCIRRLSFRSLRASRKRNGIAVIAIALTTLLFTSLFTVALSMNASYQEYSFRQIGGYSHGSFKDVTQEQASAISGHKKVKAAGERKVIGTISEGVFGKVPAEVSYMDENCTKWSYASPDEGRLPESGKEISMDTKALELLGVEPRLGAEITLTFTVGDKNQIAFEQTDTFTLAGYWEYDNISPVHYINISKEYAQEIEQAGIAAGMEPFRTDLSVMMASAVNIRGQMEQVDTDLGYNWEEFGGENSVRIGVNWGYTTEQLGQNMDPETAAALAALLLLIIFTGYLIIYNIFQISVTGDIRFYGLLKTIGVTPRQLRRIIRQQALLLCVLGIPAGLLLGYGAGAAAAPVILARTTMAVSGQDFTVISASPVIFAAAALFSLGTVLLSCMRPGRMAGKVSPVEAAKYTDAEGPKKKRRGARGAKVYQMAFANLGRNKQKTGLVVVSLALSVVLLNVLVTFVTGFDTERYLDSQTCADFIVSGTDYFRFQRGTEEYISQETMDEIRANTSQTVGGCGYGMAGEGAQAWMTLESWKSVVGTYVSGDLDEAAARQPSRDGLVAENLLLEGLDQELFQKLTVVEGDLSPLFEEDSHAIAMVCEEDDYGNPYGMEDFPAIGDTLPVSYVESGYYIDVRTGEMCDESTPEEYVGYFIEESKDVEYTVCAYVTVPYAMSFRYVTLGYQAVLPVKTLEADSGQEIRPLFYLFDTPDAEAEAEAEQYLQEIAGDDSSELMYESKSSVRAEFEKFQDMFLLLGGLLCAVIAVVGVLNFFNAVMTGILSRSREFAVLQSVGMTNRQLRSMLVYEGLFYALGAALAALILSAVLSPLAGKLLSGMFWFFSPHFNLFPALCAVPVFALLGWAIPSVVYGQSRKRSVVDRLREFQ